MKAREWHEVEAVELTQWTQRFLKYAKSLPPSAINSVAGKSTAEVLSGTDNLRHSAVHRQSTSAAGIVKMLSAAVTFTEALNDFRQAKKITEIKAQLEACIEEIIQHQNLLERKLTDQLEEIARRRAILDELERASIEEMLAVDKKQRAEIGATIENILAGYRQISKSCVCNCIPSFEELKTDSQAEENVKNPEIGKFSLPFLFFLRFLTVFVDHRSNFSEHVEKDYINDQEEKNDRDEKMKENGSSSQNIKNLRGAEKELEVLGSASSTTKAKAESKHKDKAILSEQVLPTTSNAHQSFSMDDLRASEHSAHEKNQEYSQTSVCNLSTTKNFLAEPRFAAAKGEFSGEDVYVRPVEEDLLKDIFSSDKTDSQDNQIEEKKSIFEATSGDPQTEPVIEGFDSTEEQNFNPEKKPEESLDPLYVRPPTFNIASMHDVPAEHVEFPVSRPSSVVSGVHHQIGFYSSASTGPLLIASPAIETEIPKAPSKNGHSIVLQILNGSRILRSVVLIRSCTRTAILNEARACCMRCGQYDQYFENLMTKGGKLTLISLKINEYDMNMSTYQVEDLSFLITVIEKTDVPIFTILLSNT